MTATPRDPYVSVVIPTYNRRRRLQRTLAGLAHQRFPLDQFETIVVSDGSTDGTNDDLRRGATPLPVVAAVQDNGGPAAARNRGVEMARGELVVFVDDDIVPAPQLLDAHVRAHRERGDHLVTIGPMLTPSDFDMTPWVRWEQRMLYKQYDAIRAGAFATSARQFYTGNAAIARRHILAVGGFDTSFRRAEDVELAYRLAGLGLTFAFVEDAIGYHYAERSFESWRDNAYVYGRNDVIFGRDRAQTSMFSLIAKHFASRHPWQRSLTKVCVHHARLHRSVDATLRFVAGVGTRIGSERLTQYPLSAIYGLAYHQGVADELGGAEQFQALLAGRLSQ